MDIEPTPAPVPPVTPPRRFLTVPVAIIIAGLCMSAAIYFGIVHAGSNSVVGTNTFPVKIRPVDETDHIRGNTDAPITIVEYSDLECPFCKQFHDTLKRLVNTYPDKVRWVYRHYPIPQLHSKALAEAIATECAAEQGKFWEMTDAILAKTPSNDGLDLNQVPQIAAEVGVADAPKFASCLVEWRYEDKVKADNADALLAGGSGTPHSIILGPDDEVIPVVGARSYEDMEIMVKQLF